jgi:hypothetical protein
MPALQEPRKQHQLEMLEFAGELTAAGTVNWRIDHSARFDLRFAAPEHFVHFVRIIQREGR